MSDDHLLPVVTGKYQTALMSYFIFLDKDQSFQVKTVQTHYFTFLLFDTLVSVGVTSFGAPTLKFVGWPLFAGVECRYNTLFGNAYIIWHRLWSSSPIGFPLAPNLLLPKGAINNPLSLYVKAVCTSIYCLQFYTTLVATKARILCFIFTLNPLRFSLTWKNWQKTNKSQKVNNCKQLERTFGNLAKLQLVFWSISSFKNWSYLCKVAKHFCLSVSLVRGNLRNW